MRDLSSVEAALVRGWAAEYMANSGVRARFASARDYLRHRLGEHFRSSQSLRDEFTRESAFTALALRALAEEAHS